MMTARSFGNYDLAGALADLIDNSVKAQSRSIEIKCNYVCNGDCEVRIRDDGYGMSRDELVRAMKPACANPLEERADDDLGRFGWGMKSASFSQCKVLTVVSLRGGEIIAARWDLDNIDNWEMDFFDGDQASQLLTDPIVGESGTEVVWENCDRLSENQTISRDQFNEAISDARKKLALIFHRFLSGDNGRIPRLRIAINSTELEERDPFCRSNNATIPFNEEPIDVNSAGRRHTVKMQAYVLPHYSKLSAREYEDYGGQEGYVRNQGFYVYRNRRLIIWGTWFRLAKHGELSKLVRVRIDIPNALDEVWKITVDKSDAQLPAALRERMKELVDKFRNQSRRVIGSRGAAIDDPDSVPVWRKRVRQGRIRYSINRDHPLVGTFDKGLDQDDRRLLDSLIEMIETQVPVDTINFEISNSPHEIEQNFTGRDEVVGFLEASLPALMKQSGSPEDLKDLLARTEPFASNLNVVMEKFEELFGDG